MSSTARPPDRRTAVLLGIDAGGSHCTVVVGLADLTVQGRADGPPSAMKPGGAAGAAAAIADTARRAVAQAGLELPADRAVVGAAGAGRAPEQNALAAAIREAGVAREVRVLPDGEVALSAAFGDGKSGIIVNAGTGSIAFARDAGGQIHHCGGYGWQLGDEGGGYWLGRRALDIAARAHDGRAEGSTLLARLLASLGLQRFDDLIRWSVTASPSQVAALAPHLLNAAREGDGVAQRAVGEAARELVGLAAALQRHFPGTAQIPLATTGGLLISGSPVGVAFEEILASDMPRARLVATRIDSAVGALRLAAAMS
jgi:N-acetylglucosamine kinase-like BadF-type ATPase